MSPLLLLALLAAFACVGLVLHGVAQAKHTSESLLGEYGKLLARARQRLRDEGCLATDDTSQDGRQAAKAADKPPTPPA